MILLLVPGLLAAGCHRLLPFQSPSVDVARGDTRNDHVDRKLLPCELTENNAASWTGKCNIPGCKNQYACNPQLSDETETGLVRQGVASVKFDCTSICYFDNAMRLTRTGGTWNLSAFDGFRFMIRSTVADPRGWQDGECPEALRADNPWVVLEDLTGKTRQVYKQLGQTSSPLNASLNNWITIQGPLKTPTGDWKVTDLPAGFDLAHVNSIEIHLNPWGFDGFTAWIDALTFTTTGGAPFTDCSFP